MAAGTHFERTIPRCHDQGEQHRLHECRRTLRRHDRADRDPPRPQWQCIGDGRKLGSYWGEGRTLLVGRATSADTVQTRSCLGCLAHSAAAAGCSTAGRVAIVTSRSAAHSFLPVSLFDGGGFLFETGVCLCDAGTSLVQCVTRLVAHLAHLGQGPTHRMTISL
jgi:hypothetical protein